jgi:hypothetical protein
MWTDIFTARGTYSGVLRLQDLATTAMNVRIIQTAFVPCGIKITPYINS